MTIMFSMNIASIATGDKEKNIRVLTEDGSSRGSGRSSNGVMKTIMGLHITAKSASSSLALIPIAT